jgi:hypothetical protein
MKTYEQFLDGVMPYVPGCPVPMAINAIRESVIELCEKTLLLQRDHDPVDVIANTVDYDFDTQSGYRVFKIMRAWYKDVELVPTAPDDITDPALYNQNIPGIELSKDAPRIITQKDDVTFSVLPVPKDTVRSAITMRVALKPTRTSTSIEDFIFEDYAETIYAGARFRLLIVPAKPYTNPDLALANQNIYVGGLNNARQRANRGFVRSNTSVQLRRI